LLLFSVNVRAATLIRVAALALVSWTILHAEPGPGTSGRELVVSVTFALAAAAWIAWTVRAFRSPGSIIEGGVQPEMWVMAIAGGVLTAASPSSAAAAFVFVAVIAAGIRAELRQGAWIVLAGVVALGLGQFVYGGSALATLAYVLGFAAALLGASNSRQSVVRADQAELLLAQTQRSHEEQLRAARLEESTRIAREIHDVLAHTLAGLAIQLEATASLIEQGADRDALLTRVRRAHELAREGLTETRRAVGALRGDRAAASVPDAIDALVATHRQSAPAPIRVTIDGQVERLSGAAGEAVIRVAQEALTNVRKHAPDAAVSVTLHAGAAADQPVVLIVEDRHPDGLRPTTGALASSGGGFGVPGMRERAQELGGTLSAGAVAGGWRVELCLPPSVVHDVVMEGT
jgi:signal transduction histidine kinase